MANERVALYDDEYLTYFLDEIRKISRNPTEDVAVFLLSYRAGLRAQEIAGLEWDRHVLDVTGRIRESAHETVTPTGQTTYVKIPYIQITSDIGKHNNERAIDMHVDIEAQLKLLLAETGPEGYLVSSRYKKDELIPKPVLLKKRADAVRKRMKRTYEKILGDAAVGHSSHLGRRRFLTDMTQKMHKHGMTLFDVQRMAGHKDPATTQRYIAPSVGAAHALRGL